MAQGCVRAFFVVLAALVLPVQSFAVHAQDHGARPTWSLQPGSSLTFTYRGSPMSGWGRFDQFEAEIEFDPRDPSTLTLSVVVDTTSITLGDPLAQRLVSAPRWFDLAHHLQATFEAQGAVPSGLAAGEFTTDGQLTIKGLTASIPLTFSLSLDGGRAEAVAEAVIDRTAFNLGVEDPEEHDAMPLLVTVTATIVAERQSPPGEGP